MQTNKVVWSAIAINQMGKVLEYIRKDSVQNAEKVYAKLIKKLDKVAENPEASPPDKYKKDNNGSNRVFVLFHYRISYRIESNGIRILRVRHTSMKPKYY